MNKKDEIVGSSYIFNWSYVIHYKSYKEMQNHFSNCLEQIFDLSYV